ncbi:MAG: hypothetical protein ACI9U2_000938 [Bradymonadia bacterium]|jgi:hypothetical protein
MCIGLALCPLLLLACGPPQPRALEPMPMEPALAPAPIGEPVYDPGYDMQQLQGTWEAQWGGFVIRREIVGSREQVAYYNAAGQLSRSHTADIEVVPAAVGSTQTLRWSNLQSIVGPPATPGTSTGDYQFDVSGGRMTEYHRAGPKTETIVWTRISGPPAPFAAPVAPL